MKIKNKNTCLRLQLFILVFLLVLLALSSAQVQVPEIAAAYKVSYFDADPKCLFTYHSIGRVCMAENEQSIYMPVYDSSGRVNSEIHVYKNNNLLIDGGFDSNITELLYMKDDWVSLVKDGCYEGFCAKLHVPNMKSGNMPDYADVAFLPVVYNEVGAHTVSFYAKENELNTPVSLKINYYEGPYTPSNRRMEQRIGADTYYFKPTDEWKRYYVELDTIPVNTKYIVVQLFLSSNDYPRSGAVRRYCLIDNVQYEIQKPTGELMPTPFERSTYVVEYKYYSDGRVAQLIDPGNVRRIFIHDLLGRVTQIDADIDNDGVVDQTIANYKYDVQSLLTEKSLADIATVEYKYNPRGLLDYYSAYWKGMTLIEENLSYDPSGNLRNIESQGGFGASLFYDALHRLVSVQDTGYYINSIDFDYSDEGDRLKKNSQQYIYYPGSNKLKTDGLCDYTYDVSGRVSSVVCDDGYALYSYTLEGDIAGVSYFDNQDILKYRTEYKYNVDDDLVIKSAFTDRYYYENSYLVRDSSDEIIYQEHYKYCSADDYLNNSYIKSPDCCMDNLSATFFDGSSALAGSFDWLVWGEQFAGVDYEIGETECCGDDLNESASAYRDWDPTVGFCYAPDNGCDGTTRTNLDDAACCASPSVNPDCVFNGTCYAISEFADIKDALDDDPDSSSDKELCVGFGNVSVWQDADIGDSNRQGQTYCELFWNQTWVSENVPCEPADRWGSKEDDYCDDTLAGLDPQTQEGVSENYCCGDDRLEFYKCNPEDETDCACCDSDQDVVFESVCYNRGLWDASMDAAQSGPPFEWEHDGILFGPERTEDWAEEVNAYLEKCYLNEINCTCFADQICLVPINFTAKYGDLMASELKVAYTLDEAPSCGVPDFYFQEGDTIDINTADYISSADHDPLKITLSPSHVFTNTGGNVVAKSLNMRPAKYGIYKFHVVAAEETRYSLSCEQDFYVYVQFLNNRPWIRAPVEINVTETETVAFTVEAGDIDGDPVLVLENFSNVQPGYRQLPLDATFDRTSWQFSWTTDYNSSGPSHDYAYMLYFKSVENVPNREPVSSQDVFTIIRVLNKNRPPVLEVPDMRVQEGDTLSFNLSAMVNDPDTEDDLIFLTNAVSVIQINEDGDPGTGVLSFDNAEGFFSFTPDYGQANNIHSERVYEVNFVVIDSEGGFDNKTVDIVVENNNRKPNITQPIENTFAVAEGASLTFLITGTDRDVLVDGDFINLTASGTVPDLQSKILFESEKGLTLLDYSKSWSFTWNLGFEDSGTYFLDLLLYDRGIAYDTKNITIEVVDTNRAPWIDIPDQVMFMGETLLLDLDNHSYDPDDDALSYVLIDAAPGKIGCVVKDNELTIQPSSDYFNQPFNPESPIPATCSVGVNDGKGGEDTSTFNITVIRVNKLPAVDLVSDVYTGIAPLTIRFRCSAESGDEPYNFSWDFGDSSSNLGITNPSIKEHTFTNVGNYTVRCTATDSWTNISGLRGDSAVDSVNITVKKRETLRYTLRIPIGTYVRCDREPRTSSAVIDSLDCSGNYTFRIEIERGHCRHWLTKDGYRGVEGSIIAWTGDVYTPSQARQYQRDCYYNLEGGGDPRDGDQCHVAYNLTSGTAIWRNGEYGKPAYYYVDPVTGKEIWDASWLRFCQLQNNEEVQIKMSYASHNQFIWEGYSEDDDAAWVEATHYFGNIAPVYIERNKPLKLDFTHGYVIDKTHCTRSAGSIGFQVIYFESDDYDISCNP